MRIVSDGTVPGTQVFDDHGERMSGVRSVSWNLQVGDAKASAVIEVMGVDVELDADAPEHLVVGRRGGKPERREASDRRGGRWQRWNGRRNGRLTCSRA